MWTLWRAGLLLWASFSLLIGGFYPCIIWAFAQAALPWQANGSPIGPAALPRASLWLGQDVSAADLFWSRPSATSPTPYAGNGSSGSNLGMGHPDWQATICSRHGQLRAAHPGVAGPVPVDLLTASGSGLDPDISPAAAAFQLRRVAAARGLSEAALAELVAAHTEGPTWGLLGAARVHLLPLNLALVALAGRPSAAQPN